MSECSVETIHKVFLLSTMAAGAPGIPVSLCCLKEGGRLKKGCRVRLRSCIPYFYLYPIAKNLAM